MTKQSYQIRAAAILGTVTKLLWFNISIRYWIADNKIKYFILTNSIDAIVAYKMLLLFID